MLEARMSELLAPQGCVRDESAEHKKIRKPDRALSEAAFALCDRRQADRRPFLHPVLRVYVSTAIKYSIRHYRRQTCSLSAA